MVTLYNVISADGFIARKDGGEDFIPDILWSNFLSICKAYGTIVMGRKTYDTIQSYNHALVNSFNDLPIAKIVISASKNFKAQQGYKVVSTPEEALALSPDALVSSGPTINNYLIRNNLVKKIIFHQVDVKIGEGILPYDSDLDQLLKNIEIHKIKV